jgi:3-methylcrotonyl-CoA carboxylase alpha subunit
MEGGHFYFMEMNTRLQVEHPVTEAVTGTDLVEWQLRVAAGEKFSRGEERIGLHGHAIEVRLYAENPARNFLPATGTLHGLHLPDGAGVRVETGVRQGDTVTPFYDPMIAKIIAAGADRAAALARLAQALADTAVAGVATNLEFLSRVAAAPEFAAGAVDTGFIERNRHELLPPAAAPPDHILAAAALHDLARARPGTDPWNRIDGWRLNGPAAPRTRLFRHGDAVVAVHLASSPEGWMLSIADRDRHASLAPLADGRIAITLDGVRLPARVLTHGATLAVFADRQSWTLEETDPLAPPVDAAITAGRLTSPMPGKVVQVLVARHDGVRQGQPLMVVEAMKMEHTIAAPRDGVVAAIRYAPGDLVEEGAELIALEE